MSNHRRAFQSWIRRFFGAGKRYRLAAIPIVVMLALTSFLTFAAPTPGGSHPVAVGPISGDTGFPTWYKDSNGTRLELCLDAGDNPLCGFLPGDIPDPNAPLTVPDNFPEEAFWMLGSAGLTTGGAGRATLVLALEAAFGAGPVAAGDQVSFGRVRIWIDNLIGGAQYKVTHPYGYDFFTVDAGGGRRDIRSTEDIGIGAVGDFTGALNSRIGPFLKWDPAIAPAAPAGYIGDPGVDHAVTGSPFNTNMFRVEGPPGSFVGSPDLCANPTLGLNDPTGLSLDDCIETNQFSILGKYATNAGVNATRATYTRTNGSGGSVDVFATSETGQAIQTAPSASTATTLLTGDGGGRYYARVGFSGSTRPASLQVRNVGDNPVATKTITVVDQVTITKAEYDTDADTLTIEANSGDAVLNPTLTATDFGDLAAGSLVVPSLAIAPDLITVTSAQGGSDSAHVTIIGGDDAPAPVVAGIAVPNGLAVAPIPPDTTLAFNVQQGQTVTLDGSSSSGDINSYAWVQTGGPAVALSNANASIASFTAPAQVASLIFQLTATRNAPLAVDTKSVTINVEEVAPPVADAGPDQTVAVGSTITLDGRASTSTITFAWTQTGGQAVVLNGANTARPTFVFPNTAIPLTFLLSVTGPGGGPATDTVVISPIADPLTLSLAQYTRNKNEWRFNGTATVRGVPAGPGNTITVTLNKTTIVAGVPTTTQVSLGTAPVDSLGAWTLRFTTTDPNKQPTAANTTYSVTITSSRGGLLPNRAITIK